MQFHDKKTQQRSIFKMLFYVTNKAEITSLCEIHLVAIKILQYFDFIAFFRTNQTGASLFVLAQHWPHGQTLLELFGRKGATCFQLDSDFFA